MILATALGFAAGSLLDLRDLPVIRLLIGLVAAQFVPLGPPTQRPPTQRQDRPEP